MGYGRAAIGSFRLTLQHSPRLHSTTTAFGRSREPGPWPKRDMAMESKARSNLPTTSKRELQYGPQRTFPSRIHIVGTGSVGKLVAHSLIGLPSPPPITLLYHRPTYIGEFFKAGKAISLTTSGVTETRAGLDAELSLPRRTKIASDPEQFERYMSDEPIDHLIITVKAASTISALQALKHRVGPASTILFLQNGMGITDEVNEAVFPNPQTRPNYMLGINSHGIYSNGVTSATHAGFGTIYLGFLPRVPSTEAPTTPADWNASALYLLRVLTAAPVLAAVPLSPTELLQSQIEKLAVNCVVNPLTVIMDCHNGTLLNNTHITRVMRLLLGEISLVARSLPELKGVPGVEARFSPERLESIVVNIATKTARNISSMLQDARRGVETEIGYINGYIVKRGEELGLKPLANFMLMQQVRGKTLMIQREMDSDVPVDFGKSAP